MATTKKTTKKQSAAKRRSAGGGAAAAHQAAQQDGAVATQAVAMAAEEEWRRATAAAAAEEAVAAAEAAVAAAEAAAAAAAEEARRAAAAAAAAEEAATKQAEQAARRAAAEAAHEAAHKAAHKAAGEEARRAELERRRLEDERVAMFRLAGAAERAVDRLWSFAWKIDVAIWFALLALTISTKDAEVGVAWAVCGCVLLAFLWCAYTFVWVRGMHIASSRDWDTAQVYLAAIERSLSVQTNNAGRFTAPDVRASGVRPSGVRPPEWAPRFLESLMQKLPGYVTCWWSLTRIALTTLLVVLMVLSLVL